MVTSRKVSMGRSREVDMARSARYQSAVWRGFDTKS